VERARSKSLEMCTVDAEMEGVNRTFGGRQKALASLFKEEIYATKTKGTRGQDSFVEGLVPCFWATSEEKG